MRGWAKAIARIQKIAEEISLRLDKREDYTSAHAIARGHHILVRRGKIGMNVLERHVNAKPEARLIRFHMQRHKSCVSHTPQGVAEEGKYMSTNRSRRMRWVSFMGLVMMLMSITPTGIAAQTGLVPQGDVAQGAGVPIEVVLVECPPGSPADPSDLDPACSDGLYNVGLNVASVDPALGINQPKTSVPSNADGTGPGVINTGDIPNGEYRISIDLPVEDNSFFFECKQRGTENVVAHSASADGQQNAFQVRNDGELDIVCRVWVTPTAPVDNPTMEITYRECNRADFPNDNREFADLQANCTDLPTTPMTVNVRDMNVADQPVAPHQTDAEGKIDLTLTPGNFEMFTDLDMNQYGEYLFCEYEGQPRYEKDFDPVRGIVSFSDLLPGEEITCSWFAVSSADDAPDTDAPVDPETHTPETDDPETNAPETDAPEADVQPEDVDDISFNISYRECSRGDFPSDDRSYAALNDNCVTVADPGPGFTVLSADSTQTNPTLDANGTLAFTHAPENFNIYTNLNPDSWGEYLFCSVDGGEIYQENANDGGIFGFQELVAGQSIDCQWFGVNASDVPSGEVPPVVPETPDDEDATLNISMMACPVGDPTWDTASVDAFRTNCTVPNANIAFSLENTSARLGATTNADGQASIADIPAGDWGLYSDIPMEFAVEYYFCSIDGGAYTSMPLSDRGVASLAGVDGQDISCDVFVVPNDLRGEVTGSSIEMHLSACPVGYTGSEWYADCHANGVGEQQFTISGPAGDVTADVVVERTPGPGIARFTELPAGDYVIAGGPPQDFGSVFLYCSDPATNTQVPTTFEGGVGKLTLAENQSVICDWYFVPEDGGAPTPSPTPEQTRAEIFTTMFVCPPSVNVAGSTFSQLDGACTERLNDIPMTLQSPGGVPITAKTGESGEGAIRFYDLIGGDYVLTPKLGADHISAAVYCDLNGGDVYQKALSNGSTTFVNVDGEKISCSWFVTAKPQPAPGPTGSITIREMLCTGDRSTIKDWERECQPGRSGVSFTVTSSGGGVNQTLTPDANGVAVFTGLPNEYYAVKQSEGAWCRAKAERVDSQSRVIVANGGNTDLFLYQCNQEIGLPDTGAGPIASGPGATSSESLMLGAAALPLFAIAAWQIWRRQNVSTVASEPVLVREELTRTRDGYRYR